MQLVLDGPICLRYKKLYWETSNIALAFNLSGWQLSVKHIFWEDYSIIFL